MGGSPKWKLSKRMVTMKDIFYIDFFPEESHVVTSGLGFCDFYDGIASKPKNMLLLSSRCWHAKRHSKIYMEYVDEENFPKLYKDDIYNYGDFCWIDYENEASLEKVTPQELAELLYFDHYHEPLRSAFFESLGNRYFYCAHDDDWWTMVYMRNLDDMLPVLERKILTELKGRKKSIPPIPPEIVGQVYEICKQGAIFDFERACFSHGYSGVEYYLAGRIENMDEMHRTLDRLREKHDSPGGWLGYQSKKHSWSIS